MIVRVWCPHFPEISMGILDFGALGSVSIPASFSMAGDQLHMLLLKTLSQNPRLWNDPYSSEKIDDCEGPVATISHRMS